ncbi:hypothetical protein BGZ75_007891 [Mortierella antarctica]|nr:hypothetical protein BGZ75_007891 [Mortierella antarctica]
MAPVKTRSTSSRHRNDRGYKADPEDTNDDDDFYGMRELKHQLAGMNLQLKDTMGDGNCLFRACADQFTGSEREHAALRAEVCRYIEDHEEHFKSFLDNETVEAHVAQMRKNGTYGGNIELVAFARMKRVDIKVYQPGYIFVIEGIDVKKEGSSPGQRPVMHIAWEHYSSIRNIDGPHEGPPEINPRPIKQTPLAKLTSQDPPRSIERMIMEVSGVQDLGLVRELLESYRGDVDSVYNDLDQRLQESGAESAIDTADHQDSKENNSTDQSSNVNEPCQQEVQNNDENSNSTEFSKQDSYSPHSGTPDQLCPRISTDASPTPPASPQPPSRASTPLSVAPHANSPEASTYSSSVKDQRVPSPLVEPAKGIVPKKRISKEKKELAKRNQKLNRKNKGKTGFDSKSLGDGDSGNISSGRSSSGSSQPADPPAGPDSGQRSMRELFV